MKSKVKVFLGKIIASSLVVGIAAFSLTAAPAMAANSVDTEAQVTFSDSGKLSLESAPNFDFGIQEIMADMKGYPVVGPIGPVGVMDLRGTGKGWDVAVSLTPFTTDTAEPTLEGAKIMLAYPIVTPGNGTIATPPSASGSVDLTSDGQMVQFLVAGQDAGQGMWYTEYSMAELVVYPGTARAGKSLASLKWTLQDTP